MGVAASLPEESFGGFKEGSNSNSNNNVYQNVLEESATPLESKDDDHAAAVQSNDAVADARPIEAVAVFAYEAADAEEVSFQKGDAFVDVKESEEGWLVGTVIRTGATGTLPSNYVEFQADGSTDAVADAPAAIQEQIDGGDLEALLEAAD